MSKQQKKKRTKKRRSPRPRRRPRPPAQGLISRADVILMLGCARETVVSLEKRGLLEPTRDASKTRWYSIEHVVKFAPIWDQIRRRPSAPKNDTEPEEDASHTGDARPRSLPSKSDEPLYDPEPFQEESEPLYDPEPLERESEPLHRPAPPRTVTLAAASSFEDAKAESSPQAPLASRVADAQPTRLDSAVTPSSKEGPKMAKGAPIEIRPEWLRDDYVFSK